METTDLITDIRHGGMIGFGQRWLILDSRCSITVGLSYVGNFKRAVSDPDGRDADARADYDAMIEAMPDSRMSIRPMPESNVGIGYSF
jgi:hypothetical protein